MVGVRQRWRSCCGRSEWPGGDDPVDELIATILSANTNDVNSGRAFEQLKAAFGDDWDAVRTAPLDAIKEAIRPAGMYNQKAPAIVGTLEQIPRRPGRLRPLASGGAPCCRRAGLSDPAARRGQQDGQHRDPLLLQRCRFSGGHPHPAHFPAPRPQRPPHQPGQDSAHLGAPIAGRCFLSLCTST